MLTPTARVRAAAEASQVARATAKQRSLEAKQRLAYRAPASTEPALHYFPRPRLTPVQLAEAIRANTSPPVSPQQLAGELHALRLQHQALGREIARRERQAS